MASKESFRRNQERRQRPKSEKLSFSIACMGGCGAVTRLILSGEEPFAEATMAGPDWAVLNSPDTSGMTFLCKSCFQKLGIEHAEGEVVDKEENEDETAPKWDDAAG